MGRRIFERVPCSLYFRGLIASILLSRMTRGRVSSDHVQYQFQVCSGAGLLAMIKYSYVLMLRRGTDSVGYEIPQFALIGVEAVHILAD